MGTSLLATPPPSNASGIWSVVLWATESPSWGCFPETPKGLQVVTLSYHHALGFLLVPCGKAYCPFLTDRPCTLWADMKAMEKLDGFYILQPVMVRGYVPLLRAPFALGEGYDWQLLIQDEPTYLWRTPTPFSLTDLLPLHLGGLVSSIPSPISMSVLLFI